jgi:large subunit ribosomal protein L25
VAAVVRASRGKNAARRTRRAGQIPAVVYGAYKEPVSVAVNPRDIIKIVHSQTGYNTIFNLAIEGGESTAVMLVDQLSDPVRGNLLHADFKRVDLTKRLRVAVPVRAEGEAKGIKLQGGLLELVIRAVEIECLPDDIPESFAVDVTELMIGQAKRAGDIALRAEEVAAAPEAAAATPEAGATPGAEPEVIKKGKKDEEAPSEEKGKKAPSEEKGKKK